MACWSACNGIQGRFHPKNEELGVYQVVLWDFATAVQNIRFGLSLPL
jgi:hypothetical protein